MNTIVENDILQTEYRRAQEIYSSASVAYLGRLAFALTDVKTFPVDLDKIYSLSINQLRANPNRAMAWARTYGELSVGLALDGGLTRFSLDSTQDFRPPKFVELETERKTPIIANLQSSERDAEITFLLADNGPERTEVSLIKALHMLDFALVTQMLDLQSSDFEAPLVLAATPDELLKLAADFDVRLRLYGNVRGKLDAPTTLGAVLPTRILESSGIAAYNLSGLNLRSTNLPERTVTREKINATAIGITTAKKPHIGHAFLLAKAVSQAGSDGRVLVELNDQGPRVAAAVASLALSQNVSFRQAAQEITSGKVSVDTVEGAYKARSDVMPESLPISFCLRNNNDYYRNLLSCLKPAGFTIDLVANSELYESMAPDVTSLPLAVSVFGDSGMTLLANQSKDQATVVEKAGRLTAVGVIGALCTRYNLTFVDSPRPLDQTAQSNFRENGMQVEQVPGIGVSINFNVASGTNGGSLSIDTMLERLTNAGIDIQNFLAVCRLMLNSAYYIDGNGGSLNPNYASIEAVTSAFDSAISQFVKDPQIGKYLYEPLVLKRSNSTIYRDLVKSSCGEIALEGRTSVGEVRQILAGFPGIGYSSQLHEYVSDQGICDEEIVGKKMIKQGSNMSLMQGIRTGQANILLPYLEQLANADISQFTSVIAGTMFKDMMMTMGYELAQAQSFCAKLKELRDVYFVTR